MKNILTSFSVCHSGLIIGELFKAKDITDLIENRLPKKVLNNWELISFVDSEKRSISVTKSFIEEGMTLEEVIQDWIDNGDTTEPILALNPKAKDLSNSITIQLF